MDSDKTEPESADYPWAGVAFGIAGMASGAVGAFLGGWTVVAWICVALVLIGLGIAVAVWRSGR